MGEETIDVRVARAFRAPAERVFDAWLDPESARQWLFATPDGEMIRVEMDAREGGRWTVVERRGDDDAFHQGTYRTIDRPQRLVFTFAADPDEAPSRVTVRITPIGGGGGGCELELVHRMDARWAEWADRTRHGWQRVVDGLARTLGEA